MIGAPSPIVAGAVALEHLVDELVILGARVRLAAGYPAWWLRKAVGPWLA